MKKQVAALYFTVKMWQFCWKKNLKRGKKIWPPLRPQWRHRRTPISARCCSTRWLLFSFTPLRHRCPLGEVGLTGWRCIRTSWPRTHHRHLKREEETVQVATQNSVLEGIVFTVYFGYRIFLVICKISMHARLVKKCVNKLTLVKGTLHDLQT